LSFKYIMFAAVAASIAAPTGAVQPAPAPHAAPSRDGVVEIPFAPPLGRVLRYRLTRDGVRAGRPFHSEATLAVTFTRPGAGYLLSVRLELPPGVPPPDRSSAMARIFSLPTEFRLADDGTFIEIVDLERHWATALAVLRDHSLAQPLDARGQRAMDAVLSQMRALPPEAQLELFARNVAPLTAVAGRTLRPGEEVSDTGRARSIAGTFTRNSTLRLEATNGTAARISTRSTVPAEELEARTRELVTRLAPGRPLGAFRILSNETIETLEVSLLTGLAERYRVENIVVTEEDGQRRRAVELQTLELVTAP
jgi:hypothetical protein